MKKQNMENNTRKSGKKRGLIALMLCGILAVGGVAGMSAYFTDTKQSVNTFEVGKIEVEHHEDNWTPDPQDITPNQEFVKDPTVENVGDNSAFVFQTVKVPAANVITADVETGLKLNSGVAARTDLFSYTINSGWYMMDTENVTEDGQDYTKYTYVYGTASKCTELAKGAATPSLFDKVTFANVIEDQGLEQNTYSMIIDCYAIQTTDLTAKDTTNPYDVLGIIYNQAK